LHGAAQIGWTSMVSLLIEHGADPAIEDSFGTTALEHALGRGGRFSNSGGGDVHLETAAFLQSLMDQ
jgi:ankyrin repeat protein